MTVSAAKKQNHRFQPGQSGNPNGRPKGSRNKATIAVETILDGEAEALTRKAIELALGGDGQALRICLDRICPPRKGRTIELNLPDMKDANGVAEAQSAVLQAVGEGTVSPDEGKVIADIIEARRKAIETLDHEKRLAVLERVRNA
ncbi:DUF5681 domain-containing protein [Hwanghaeella sp.]|uniref:DUF5681 domain-containing protein n=1 Tax=Hwanghaeella sp. TaxID=2605943 RepID=UPI003CCC06AD